MEILIISGLSGAGKSKTASFLEDMGFYIVDNMPAAMILKFSEFCAAGGSRYRRAALVYDVRTAETEDTPSDFFAVPRAWTICRAKCSFWKRTRKSSFTATRNRGARTRSIKARTP